MDDDDKPVGRILSRREVLGLFGMAGASLLAGCLPQAATPLPTAVPTLTPISEVTATEAHILTATQAATVTAQATATAANMVIPSCVVRPALTEGPFYVDEQLERSDIRPDPSNGTVAEGAEFKLTFSVSHVADGACQPLAGAVVDIWHCDAYGIYSDVSGLGMQTIGQKFLRGYQVTDANGQATFTTIYPGWYISRTVHIHFKVRPSLNSNAEFISQLFFEDTVSDEVFAQAPYASKGQRRVLNTNDGIYDGTLLLTVNQTDTGYAATFEIGLTA